MNKFPIITEFASQEVPKFLEKKNKNIVWYGVDNMYPYELIDLYNDSSTHNAIINGKVGYTIGNGLEGEDLETKKWLSQANIDQDWTSLMKSLSLDYEIFNGYAIEVIKTKVGNQYHHIDFANIRVGLDGSIQYADDWITDKGTKNSKPDIQYLERYNPRNPEQKRGVIYHVDYRPNFKYYPLPVYVGSLAEIKTDVQIGDYWLNEVENGFVGGTLIQHNNGVPETKEEAEAFEKAFQEKFGKATGTKIVHLFSPAKDNSSEITSLNGNDLHERYTEMSKRVKESIFIGHRVTNPILFGVKEEGQLGARNELDLAYEIFTNTYIAERQNTLLRTIKKLAFYEIQKTDIEIIPLKPIDVIDLTSDIILANLDREEIRELITDQTGLELKEAIEEPVESNFVEPKAGEQHDPFMSRCISKLVGEEGYEQAQASAICHTSWEDVHGETEMSDFQEDDKEMVDGIIELLLKVEDLENRKKIVLDTLRDFDEDGVIYDRKDFLNRVGVALDEKMSACSCFSKDEDISHLFDNIGVLEKEYEIVESFNINFDTDGSPIEFATEEQGILQRVLKTILTNPLIAASGISEVLGLNFEQLVGAVNILNTSDLITIDGSEIGLTNVGERVAKTIDVPETEVKYRYELRPDAPPLKGESRDFCRKMMAKKRLYSKKEIEVLRNGMKSSSIADVTDVWLARGGWYRKPETNTSVPYCRHIWKQVIVRKR